MRDDATAAVTFTSPLAAYESPLHLLVSGRLLDADGNLVARLVSGSGWHTEGR